MDTFPFDPVREKEALSVAMGNLQNAWGTSEMAHALSALCEAAAQAERAFSILEMYQDKDGIAFKVHVLGLGAMTQLARDEIERAQRRFGRLSPSTA